MTHELKIEAVVKLVCETFQITEKEFEIARSERKSALKAGKSEEEFWSLCAQKKGIELPKEWPQMLRAAYKEAINVAPEMYLFVELLKEKNIPVAMLSNIDSGMAKIIKEFGYYEPFDPCLLSCELGVDKPERKIYEILLEKLNLPATEVIFIDDLPQNVTGAKALGIDALLFQSQEQLKEELTKRNLL